VVDAKVSDLALAAGLGKGKATPVEGQRGRPRSSACDEAQGPEALQRIASRRIHHVRPGSLKEKSAAVKFAAGSKTALVNR
jgi:hypothetical protein